MAVNVILAQRDRAPLSPELKIVFLVCLLARLRERIEERGSLREITSDLPACGLSRMASRSIRGRREGKRTAYGEFRGTANGDDSFLHQGVICHAR